MPTSEMFVRTFDFRPWACWSAVNSQVLPKITSVSISLCKHSNHLSYCHAVLYSIWRDELLADVKLVMITICFIKLNEVYTTLFKCFNFKNLMLLNWRKLTSYRHWPDTFKLFVSLLTKEDNCCTCLYGTHMNFSWKLLSVVVEDITTIKLSNVF